MQGLRLGVTKLRYRGFSQACLSSSIPCELLYTARAPLAVSRAQASSQRSQPERTLSVTAGKPSSLLLPLPIAARELSSSVCPISHVSILSTGRKGSTVCSGRGQPQPSGSISICPRWANSSSFPLLPEHHLIRPAFPLPRRCPTSARLCHAERGLAGVQCYLSP